MLCPNCRLLISRDESRCPHCGLARPGAWRGIRFLTGAFRSPRLFVKYIIYANLAMYLFSLLLNPWPRRAASNPLALFSPSNLSLMLLGETGTIPIDSLHRWWTLLSANYLHGGILHILFNMVALWQLAPLVISEFGTYRMFLIYTLGGVGGYLLSYVAGIQLTIGASAAVCGLIGATLYYGASRGGPYGRALFRQVSGWTVMIFLFGFLAPGINNWGHGGGIIAGALLAFLLGYERRTKENILHRTVAGVLAALTVVILLWAVITAFYYRFGTAW